MRKNGQGILLMAEKTKSTAQAAAIPRTIAGIDDAPRLNAGDAVIGSRGLPLATGKQTPTASAAPPVTGEGSRWRFGVEAHPRRCPPTYE